jgi:hypothetical protein
VICIDGGRWLLAVSAGVSSATSTTLNIVDVFQKSQSDHGWLADPRFENTTGISAIQQCQFGGRWRCSRFKLELQNQEQSDAHYKAFISLPRDLPRQLFCRRVRKSRSKLAVNDIMFYREILSLSRLYRKSFAANLQQSYCEFYHEFTATFTVTLPRINREFTTKFTANLPRVYTRYFYAYIHKFTASISACIYIKLNLKIFILKKTSFYSFLYISFCSQFENIYIFKSFFISKSYFILKSFFCSKLRRCMRN